MGGAAYEAVPFYNGITYWSIFSTKSIISVGLSLPIGKDRIDRENAFSRRLSNVWSEQLVSFR